MSDRAQMLATAMQSPRRPTVDTAVEQYFGMKPGMDRLNLLPRHDSKQGWVAPNMVYQLARAMVSPGVAAQGGDVSPEDAVNFAGNVSLGGIGASAAMKNPAPGPGKTVAATVYHGSPHRINNVTPDAPLGRFDTSKIGTGEGAQAYGHGLYLADNPKVAGTYSELGASRFFVDGNEIPPSSNWDAQLRADITAYRHPSSLDREIESLRDHAKTFGNAKSAEAADILAAGKANPARISERKGHLYTADLPDEHIAKMLDWDAPLSQQPESVRAAFKRRITEPKAIDGMDMGGNARLRDNRNGQADPNQVQPWVLETTSGNGVSRFGLSQKDVDRLIGGKDINALTGAQIYQRMAAEHGGFPQASEMLRKLGIPGVRYLDGGSRANGAGTSNYVIFDGDTAKILKRE